MHSPKLVHERCTGWDRERRDVAAEVEHRGVEPFIGSQAVASGALTRGQLHWNYVAILPDVYVPKDAQRHLWTNAHAAWQWSRRTGIVAGQTAAALYGVDIVDDSAPVQLISRRGRRSRRGVIVRRELIGDDEVQTTGTLPMTTAARTALDLARQLPRDDAVVMLDGLAAATELDYSDVDALIRRYRGTRGMAQARESLRLMNGATRSPADTRLRLLLDDAGFPAPHVAITLEHGPIVAVLGMGWPELKLGVSAYVAPEDATNPYLVMHRIRRQDVVTQLGWAEVVVTEWEPRSSVIYRIRKARRARGARC